MPTPAIVAVVNVKGGVGKTSVTVALAGELASRNHRVLVIDTNPQGKGSASSWLDSTSDQLKHLAWLDTTDPINRDHLKQQMVDFVVVDTPPNAEADQLGQAVDAADIIVIPWQEDGDDIAAQAFGAITERARPGTVIGGLLVNELQTTIESAELITIRADLNRVTTNRWGPPGFETIGQIRKSADFKRARRLAKLPTEVADPTSGFRTDLQRFATWVETTAEVKTDA